MSGCNQSTITYRIFDHLKGSHKLDTSLCDQLIITDNHLNGVHTLDISSLCDQIIADGEFYEDWPHI